MLVRGPNEKLSDTVILFLPGKSPAGAFVKRWTKILIAVAVVVVALILAIPLFVNANTFRPVIQKQLSQVFGRDVKFGDLKLSVLHGQMTASDLTVSEDPAFGAGPFLTADQLRIGIRLRPLLFSHELEIRSFVIESPKINVTRGQNGTWNVSSIGHHVQAVAQSGKTPGPLPPLPDLKVALVNIDDGTITASELPAQGDPSVYKHVNVEVRDFSFTSSFPFQLGADLPAGGTVSVVGHAGPVNRDDAATTPLDAELIVKGLTPVAAGFLNPESGFSLIADLDMKISSDGTTLTNSGSALLTNLKLRKGASAAPKPIGIAYKGTHVLKAASGTIEDAAIQVGDAAIHLNGTYQPVGSGASDPNLNLKLTGQSLPVDDLQPLMTAAGIRLPNNAVLKGGTIGINLAVSGQAKSLVIVGDISADKTRMVGFDVGSKIHGIAALSGVKTGDTTDIDQLRAHIRMSNTGVVVDKVYAVIPAMGELTGSGVCSPANQLDFNLVAKVENAGGIGKIGVGLMTALHGGSGDQKGVPLKVVGTPDDPVITADLGDVVGKTKHSITGFFTGKKKESNK
jgi:AsmA protein